MKNSTLLRWLTGAALVVGMLPFLACEQAEGEKAPTPAGLVRAMTLEQKAQLVVGTGMYFPMPDSIRAQLPAAFRNELDTTQVYGKMVNRIRAYLPGTAGITAEYPGLGITSQALADGPAGLRISPTRPGDDATYYCTAYPIATLLASSWDTGLVERVGQAMGNEVKEYGADVILGPGMNLQRDPLCGRNFEYYSEDPLVTGKMAAAMVKGIQSNGVGTSIKHYAANNQETNRLSVNTIVSQRALRELYLRGFEIAVTEGRPWTVMSSYNKINGVYASESPELLTSVLRDDWGFDGYVVTDWGGGSDPVAQMLAGNDLIMPGSYSMVDTLIAAVNKGALDEAVLDRNAERILAIMLKTPRYQGYAPTNTPPLKEHAHLARQAAAEGMVLLENQGGLPIAKGVGTIAAFGNASYDFISGGTGSGDVNEAYTVSLTEALETAGYQVDATLRDTYLAYLEHARATAVKPQNMLAAMMGGKIPVAEMELPPATAARMAAGADLALITIGRNAGEGGDREAVPGDYYLTDTEKNLISRVTAAFHKAGKKAVVILNIAGVVETDSWSNIPDAVLCAWQPGQEGGNSVVDVLTGAVNPSGKLAVSFPKSYDDTPTAKNFPGQAPPTVEGEDTSPDLSGFSFMQRLPWEVVYEEDIYVGYRYYDTFEVPVAYAFGYGKSYTTFEYGDLELSSGTFAGTLTATLDVTNTGAVPGREVVQLYLAAPEGGLNKPAKVLAGFAKTGNLAPGATEQVTFTLDARSLAFFDTARSAWVVEAGTYTLGAGASSRDIREKTTFRVEEEMVAGKVANVLAPHRAIESLKR